MNSLNSAKMDASDSELEVVLPPGICEISQEASLHLLPCKSREIYEKKYEELMVWCRVKGVNVSENVLLSYFSLKAKVMKSPSLWSLYSMLKATLKVKNDIDIKDFHKLTVFLKLQSVGYKPNKSKTLSQENISKFLLQAPNEDFLMKKVVLIFGIAGACRRYELVKMTTDDVDDRTTVLVVTVPGSMGCKSRVFTITSNTCNNPNINYLAICKRYFKLRPKKPTTNRLFLNYKKGVCTNQVVGMNAIAKIPSDIANYLGLPEYSQYTGHCFRRTSATLLVEDITQLKHGGWKSTAVGKGYIDDGMQTKNTTVQKIFGKENQLAEIGDMEEGEALAVQAPDPRQPCQSGFANSHHVQGNNSETILPISSATIKAKPDENETILPDTFIVNIKEEPHSEPEEREEVACLICAEVFSCPRLMEQHVIEEHSTTDYAKELQENMKYNYRYKENARDPLDSSKSSEADGQPFETSEACSYSATVVGGAATSLESSTFTDPLTKQAVTTQNKFFLLIPQTVRTTAISQKQPCTLYPPTKPLPNPGIDTSETFSISLAEFTPQVRKKLKTKIMELVTVVRLRNFNPDNMVIAFKESMDES